MALTAQETATIKKVLALLEKPNLGCNVSNTRVLHDSLLAEINAEGKEVVTRLYLNTWILGELESLLP